MMATTIMSSMSVKPRAPRFPRIVFLLRIPDRTRPTNPGPPQVGFFSDLHTEPNTAHAPKQFLFHRKSAATLYSGQKKRPARGRSFANALRRSSGAGAPRVDYHQKVAPTPVWIPKMLMSRLSGAEA
jgi:hypothetical protein